MMAHVNTIKRKGGLWALRGTFLYLNLLAFFVLNTSADSRQDQPLARLVVLHIRDLFFFFKKIRHIASSILCPSNVLRNHEKSTANSAELVCCVGP